jgi:16S rRNA C1402 (ribose-2'-O) methylase RsmI
MYEENIRGGLVEIIAHYAENEDTIKGEIVIVIGGASTNTEIKSEDSEIKNEKKSKKWRT